MARAKPPKAPNGEGSLRYDAKRKTWVARVSYRASDGSLKGLKAENKDRAAAAEKWRELQQRKARLERGAIKPGQAPTVGEWLDHWLRNLLKDETRPSTRRDYELAVRLYIKPHIGDKRLDRLRIDDVRNMLKTVQSAAPRSAQKAYQALSSAMKRAVRERAIAFDANPMLAIDKPAHTAAQRKAFTAATARHIIATAVDVDRRAPGGARLASRWAAAFWTGARQGELLGLEWERVDLERNTLDLSWQLQQLQQVHGCGEPTDSGPAGWQCGVHRPGHCPQRRWDLPPGFVHRVVHRSLVLTHPKSTAGTRVVPIAAPLRAMLIDHRDATAGEANPHGLVWHYRDGRPINPRDDYAEWKRLLRGAGVIDGAQTLPLHMARHTTASLLLEAGVDARVIKDMIGHSTVVMTQAYQHVDLTLAHDAMNKLGGLLADEEPPTSPPGGDGQLAKVVSLSARRRRA